MFINGTHIHQKTLVLLRTIVFGMAMLGLFDLNGFAQNSRLAGNLEARALFEEAKTYHDGDGVLVDLQKAHTLYKEAAALGDIDARINLGYMYFVGEGVQQSYEVARHYYLPAANAGDDAAQKNLGAMYEHGLGVEKNMETAQIWYDKSEGIITPVETIAKIIVPNKSPKIPEPAQMEPIKPEPTIIVAQAPKPTPKPDQSSAPILAQSPSQPSTVSVEAAPITKAASKALSTRWGMVASTARAAIIPDVTHKSASNITRTNVGTMDAVTNIAATSRPALILKRSPKWVSSGVGAFLLFVALMGAVWYALQLRKLHKNEAQYHFAAHFFARHRETLRGSYLRTPESQRAFIYPQDPWAVAVCALMVRFARQRQDDPETRCRTSAEIMRALDIAPYQARLTTFDLVPMVQDRLFADIKHLNKNTVHPPKPFQFKYTKFLPGTKRKKVGNTRPAPLRLVN